METIELIIDKNQIEAILNGERIEQEVDGIKYVIRQSYLQPMAMPLVNRPIKAINTENNTVMNKRYFNHLVNDSFNR
ncbi:hypothetical protein [Macrococcoides caseolyticum]|uniref:hypothetical protein n=1 Tax=Macrococcoides caseolyticum TaxID=69966 RepID=UPI000C3462B1|nr:hypothetical protein [Macrococcus caseolyticus]PKE63938.1 hypothetical protein CW683_03090 [Macrococcus caseolyticus]PKE65495.1 hypothetical protein CW674_05990 [Macrococcus caseolyticus]